MRCVAKGEASLDDASGLAGTHALVFNLCYRDRRYPVRFLHKRRSVSSQPVGAAQSKRRGFAGNQGIRDRELTEDLEEFVLFSTVVMARQLAANSLVTIAAVGTLRFLFLFILAAVFCTIALSW
jgi:hypothetical protein